MSVKGCAPGWVARCSKCPYEVDLESLGWIRIGAYSWGKRHSVHCPDCNRTRWMRILHVDENGEPDQPFGLVLRKVLGLQLLIWCGVLSVLALFAIVGMVVVKMLQVAEGP